MIRSFATRRVMGVGLLGFGLALLIYAGAVAAGYTENQLTVPDVTFNQHTFEELPSSGSDIWFNVWQLVHRIFYTLLDGFHALWEGIRDFFLGFCQYLEDLIQSVIDMFVGLFILCDRILWWCATSFTLRVLTMLKDVLPEITGAAPLGVTDNVIYKWMNWVFPLTEAILYLKFCAALAIYGMGFGSMLKWAKAL